MTSSRTSQHAQSTSRAGQKPKGRQGQSAATPSVRHTHTFSEVAPEVDTDRWIPTEEEIQAAQNTGPTAEHTEAWEAATDLESGVSGAEARDQNVDTVNEIVAKTGTRLDGRKQRQTNAKADMESRNSGWSGLQKSMVMGGLSALGSTSGALAGGILTAAAGPAAIGGAALGGAAGGAMGKTAGAAIYESSDRGVENVAKGLERNNRLESPHLAQWDSESNDNMLNAAATGGISGATSALAPGAAETLGAGSGIMGDAVASGLKSGTDQLTSAGVDAAQGREQMSVDQRLYNTAAGTLSGVMGSWGDNQIGGNEGLDQGVQQTDYQLQRTDLTSDVSIEAAGGLGQDYAESIHPGRAQAKPTSKSVAAVAKLAMKERKSKA